MMLFPALFLLCSSTAPQEGSADTQALVWEHRDPRTEASGAARLLRGARVEVRELDLDRPLAKQNADMLVLGTRLCDHHRYAEWMEAHRAELLAWVRRGHVLVQFAQDWRKEERPPFLPGGTTAARGDGDLASVYAIEPRHLLLRGLPLTGEEEPVLDLPRHLGKGPAFGFFDVQAGGEVIAAGDPAGEMPVILEFRAERGRILLVGIAFDKLWERRGQAVGSKRFRDAAELFFLDLAEYAWHVRHRSEEARDFAHFLDREELMLEEGGHGAASAGAAPVMVPIEILVYADQDGDGERDEGEKPLSGVAVAHLGARTRTGEDGLARLAVPPLNAPGAWVRVPAGFSLTSPFRIVLDAGAAAGLHVEVGLRPPPEREEERRARSPMTIAFLAGASGDRLQALREALDRLPRERRPLFAVAGDRLLPLPAGGGREDLLQPRTPRLSWEVPGWHCLLLAREEVEAGDLAWLQAELTEVAQGRRALVFLAAPPDDSLLAMLAAAPVGAVVHGGAAAPTVHREGKVLVMGLPTPEGAAAGPPVALLLDAWTEGEVGRELLPLTEDRPRVLAPADGDPITEGRAPALVLLPPHGGPAPSVRLLLGGGAGAAEASLEPVGLLTWAGRLRVPEAGRRRVDWSVRLEAAAPGEGMRRAAARVSRPGRAPRPAESGDFTQALGGARRAAYVTAAGSFRGGFGLAAVRGSALVAPCAPRLHAGRLYVAGNGPAGPGGNALLCLDAATGAERWRAALPDPPRALAVHPLAALVLLRDGRVAAFSLDFGDPLWTVPAPAAPAGQACAPILDGDRLLLAWPGGAASLDLLDGSTQWSVKTPSAEALGNRQGGSADAGLAAGRLVVADRAGLHLLDARDGALLASWEGPAASPILSRHARELRVLRNGRVEGWQAADRERRQWDQEMASELLPGGAAGRLAAGGRKLLVSCGDGRLRAYDDRSGEALWEQPPLWDASAGPPFLLLTSAELLVLERGGRLRLLEARRGKLLAARDLGLPFTAAPALVRNRIHLAAWDGALLELAPALE